MKKLLLLFVLAVPIQAYAASGQETCELVAAMVASETGVVLGCSYEWLNLDNLGNGNVYGFKVLRGTNEPIAGVAGFISGVIVQLDNDVPTKSVGVAIQNGGDIIYVRMSDLRRCHRTYSVGTNVWSMCVIKSMATN